jgi:hypothetical protein
MRWTVLLFTYSLSLIPATPVFAAALTHAEKDALEGDTDFEIEGKFVHEESDTLLFTCGRSICSDILVRDSFLLSEGFNLIGKNIELIVRRVPACDKHLSTEVACVRSLNGSALKIIKWLDPAHPK